jgi:oligoendopeptidase F
MKSNPLPKKRNFLPADFKITDWDSIKEFYELLLNREINSLEGLRIWLSDRSELEGIIAEDAGWRYIHMTCNTGNEAYRKDYEEYITAILPNLMPLSHQLDEKVVKSPYTTILTEETGYGLLIRCLETTIQLYRAVNIPLFTSIQLQAQEYGKIVSEMTITRDGQEFTLQQAATYLESADRKLREEVYQQMSARRLQDKDTLDTLYSSLVKERHTVATNAGFKNFTAYSFKSLKRFDYTEKDCFAFHESIKEVVVPFIDEIAANQKKLLNVEKLRPWDHHADPHSRPPLKAFQNTEELLQKTIKVLDKLHPFMGNCLRTMQHMGRFDLDSRKGKAPGGYNYPLAESGVPFIFMNAADDFQNVITLLHESGHAIHSFLMHSLPLNDFKHVTSEMAELASMSMELLTMDYWDIFLDNPTDVKRAKREHLEGIIKRLAWIAVIDRFQHWVYMNPNHTSIERKDAWNVIFDEFSDKITDWDNYEETKNFLWQKQLHLFEVPFYYIEYGIAQLGAIGIWKNYKQDPAKALHDYLNALQLGYMQPLPYMYNTAGTQFNLSKLHIESLVNFLRTEWKQVL